MCSSDLPLLCEPSLTTRSLITPAANHLISHLLSSAISVKQTFLALDGRLLSGLNNTKTPRHNLSLYRDGLCLYFFPRARLYVTCSTTLQVSVSTFRNLRTKLRKNYETLDLQFRKITKIEKQNYETRKKTVTSTDR